MGKQLKIGARVETPDGKGSIVGKEHFTRVRRWGVKLDEEKFPHIPHYFDNQLNVIDE